MHVKPTHSTNPRAPFRHLAIAFDEEKAIEEIVPSYLTGGLGQLARNPREFGLCIFRISSMSLHYCA
jgi:hypothetical protein